MACEILVLQLGPQQWESGAQTLDLQEFYHFVYFKTNNVLGMHP